MKIEWRGKRVVVMGLGRFGGGAGAVRWLHEHGADVLVTDLADPHSLRESLDSIEHCIRAGGVTLRLGEHRESDFRQADAIVVNPAVPTPWLNTFLRAAMEAGVPITTEIRLVVEQLNRERVIGVTGSAGKSTTAAMIHHALQQLGVRANLGGNIGGSLLNEVEEIARRDIVVLELSSAQLYWLGEAPGYDDAKPWSPHVAVITNISPNHLNWHGSFEHYVASKWNIARAQDEADSLILGDSSLAVHDEVRSHVRVADAASIDPPALLTPGVHNRRNAGIAAHAAAAMVKIDVKDAARTLDDFRGLPHRLELIGEWDQLRFINDSKSTTPEATILACAALGDCARIHVIAGGSDKGADLSPIAQLARDLAGLYTIGATGRMLAGAAPAGSFARFCDTLDCAVETALDRMKPGDTLLLSPGCASFDQFSNYTERGEAFRRLVTAARSHLART